MLRRLLLLACSVVAAAASGASAQYKIDWSVIASGGGSGASASYRLSGTVGQSAAGFVKGGSLLHWVGFWAGDVPSPTVAATLGDAKTLPDGTFVSVAGKIATSGETQFSQFFYLEEADRSSGIRVATGDLAGIGPGKVINVIGTLGTTAAGERQIAGPIVIVVATDVPLEPLGMKNSSIGGQNLGTPPNGQYGVTGGAGTNNVGLLIETWGRVTASAAGYVMIDDGSGPVKVDTTTLNVPPALDSFVTVIGISSLDKPGADRLRLVLPRANTDVVGH